MIIRQGDVLLILRNPEGAQPPPGPAQLLTLAVGEESGHAHVLRGIESRRGDQRFVTLTEPADLHVSPAPSAWRHDPITIPPGTYEIVIEREYAPDAIRTVAD